MFCSLPVLGATERWLTQRQWQQHQFLCLKEPMLLWASKGDEAWLTILKSIGWEEVLTKQLLYALIKNVFRQLRAEWASGGAGLSPLLWRHKIFSGLALPQGKPINLWASLGWENTCPLADFPEVNCAHSSASGKPCGPSQGLLPTLLPLSLHLPSGPVSYWLELNVSIWSGRAGWNLESDWGFYFILIHRILFYFIHTSLFH